MKISVLTFALILGALQARCTIHTVSNDVNHPAQFSDIQSALNAANAGDTIYVNGTQYLYPDFEVSKKAIIIGAGYNSSNQLNLNTTVNNISLNKTLVQNDASGTVIMGFMIYDQVGLASGSSAVNNITLTRNFFRPNNNFTVVSICSTCSNWLIYNNIFINCCGGSYTVGIDGGNGSTNVIIQNNFFSSEGNGIQNFNQSSVVIDHNIFQNTGIAAVKFATITNNIYVTTNSRNFMDANTNYNIFDDNLSIVNSIGPDAPTNSFLGGTNSGAGNQVGVDPLFTAVADLNNFNYSFNYRLQSGSPGHNAGTDGTDLGVYGGTYPFPSGGTPGGGYDTSAPPPIPQVTGMNIQNASVLPAAQLKVTVQATINN